MTKELLERLYVEETKSLRVIGDLYGKSPASISRYLKKFGIKARPFSTKGTNNSIGKKLTNKTKEKIRKARLGKKLSHEHRNKVVKNLHFGVKGKENPHWKGGRIINPKGYAYLRLPNHPQVQTNGYVAEHRYVMEIKIGRLLTNCEHVHHLNGIKDDNRPENLELLNGQTHTLVTMLTNKVRSLEEEIKRLKGTV